MLYVIICVIFGIFCICLFFMICIFDGYPQLYRLYQASPLDAPGPCEVSSTWTRHRLPAIWPTQTSPRCRAPLHVWSWGCCCWGNCTWTAFWGAMVGWGKFGGKWLISHEKLWNPRCCISKVARYD